ncbi:MAG: hypothetical protein HY903_21100 [Deltaproteobacteria bacterium]|nr:hypothetical protein [Deltaproteobacteria bacterium]
MKLTRTRLACCVLAVAMLGGTSAAGASAGPGAASGGGEPLALSQVILPARVLVALDDEAAPLPAKAVKPAPRQVCGRKLAGPIVTAIGAHVMLAGLYVFKSDESFDSQGAAPAHGLSNRDRAALVTLGTGAAVAAVGGILWAIHGNQQTCTTIADARD